MEPDNLIQQIHDFFLNQYNGSLDGTNTFLAFEPLGLMISPDDFQFNGSFNATVAQQQVSIMADTVPAISDVFEPDAFNKISDQYGQLVGDGENMVGTLEFCDANIDPGQTDQYLAYFGFLKKIAQQKFSQTGEQASILNPSAQVAACNVTPSTWYDPASPIWQQKTFQSATPATNTTTTPTAPVLNWKLGLNLQKTPVTGTVYTTLNTHLKLLNIASEPAAVAAPPTAQPAATATTAPANRMMMERPMALNMRQAQTVTPQTVQPVRSEAIMARPVITQAAPLMLSKVNYSALRTAVPFSQMVNVNRVIGLNNNAVTQPVNSSQFSVDFSYSLVRFERDWMYQPLIDKASIWYSLTNLAGDYSTGKNSSDNQGLLRCIPKAMIVVKDLNISAQWSAADIQMAASSFGFGCFNISNSPPITSASQQLSAPGIQVIAWICEVMPQLPVNSDPGMVGAVTDTTPSSTTTTTTDTGTQTTTTGSNNTDTSTGTSTTPTSDSSGASTNTPPATTTNDTASTTPVTADNDAVSQPQATN